MESSSSSEEPYIDSFFLPEGILDSEDDDLNSAALSPQEERLLSGGAAALLLLAGAGGEEEAVLTPADELMPSFLQANKATWTAPPLLIPSQTAEDVAGFYHHQHDVAADDDVLLEESRTSHHSPLLLASQLTQAIAPRRLDDLHVEEVRDCPTHDKDLEPTSPPTHRVACLLSPKKRNSIVDNQVEVEASSPPPPPGFGPSKLSGSPKSVSPQRNARSGSKGGAVREQAAKHQRVISPSPPEPSLPALLPFHPQRRDGPKGNDNHRQSYASVLLAEAKNEASLDGSVRNQNVSNASVSAPPYATPPRTSNVGAVSNRSAERRHHSSFAGSAAVPLLAQADDSTSSSGITASSHSGAGRPEQVTSGPHHLSTPSKSARQRNPRRQRKPKALAGPDHPVVADAFVEIDSSDSQRFKRESITSDSSSTSSSGVDVDGSTSSSSHTELEESQGGKGDGHDRRSWHRAARDDSAAERVGAARSDKSAVEPVVDAAARQTARSFPRFDVASVSEAVAPFLSAWEIVLPLVLGCFSFIGVLFAAAAKVIILLALGLAETCRYAAEEVRLGDGGAAVSYLALLFLPACCDLMMASFSLPHFTPHFVSTVTICQLCQQSSSRKLYSTSPSGFLADDRLAENLSQTVLRVARYALLVAELHEGFSRANMSYMIADAPTRALLAFALALARSNLLLSPVGWTSASMQWLIAWYAGRNVVSAAALVLMGMASVQLSRRVQQPAEVDAPALRRHTLGGDEVRGSARSGPGKRPSVRL